MGFWTNVSPAGKTLTIIGGLGLTVFGIVELRKWQKGKADRDAKKNVQAYLKNVDTDIKDTKQTPTKNKTNFVDLATQLYQALNNVFGGDADQVYRVFAQANNDADVLEIIKAFAVQPYTGGVYTQVLTLPGFITKKLTSDEITQLNMMLAKKAIRFRF